MKTFDELGIVVPYAQHGELDVACPFCPPRKSKNRKDLSINTETGTYHCHHCGASGKAKGDGDNSWSPSAPKVYVKPQPKPGLIITSEEAYAWFAHRGINRETINEAGITSDRAFSPIKGEEVNCITFPYFRDGELINIKYRAQPKQFWMAKGAERILYGLDELHEAVEQGFAEFAVTEGEMDALTIRQETVLPAISVPDGAPSPETKNYASKFSFLADPYFEAMAQQAKTIYIAVDMDEPGKRLAEELARRFGFEKCKRVFWPEGCKDANETLMKLGGDAVREAVYGAPLYPVKGIVTVREIFENLDNLYDSGYPTGLDLGYPAFAEHYRPERGLMAIWTGMPGHGKSAMLDNVLVRLADRHGWRIGVCSPENQPLERHASALMSIHAGKAFDYRSWYPPGTSRMTKEEMHFHRQWLDQHFTFIMPEDMTIEGIIEMAQLMVYREGIDALVIDPWSEIDHKQSDGGNISQQTNRELTILRNFARRSKTHLMLVAHPTKMHKVKEDGKYPVPTMYDISDSAHFNNKADYGVSVYRDASNNTSPTQVHVQKVRFREMGVVGTTEFSYNSATHEMTELPDGKLPMVYANRIGG